jgi:signal transduction histidine kinase
MGLMFLYNLFLFFVTRDKLYLWYISYVLFAIPAILYTHNYPFFHSVFNETISKFLSSHPFVWLNTPFIFVCFFAIRFLNLSEKPYLRKILLGLSFYAILILAALDFFSIVPHSTLVHPSQILTLVGLVYSFSISLYIWIREKKINARFYTLAWVWILLALVFYFLTVNGVMEYTFLSRNALLFGIGIEALMFSLALGDRINTMRDENFLLIENQNQVLEQKVSERTQELENLNATKDKFFSIIAHDLRNPFAGIMGISEIMESELLENKKEDDSNFLEYTRMIFSSAQSALSLINNLTQWAKSQTGEIIINHRNISLKTLLSNTIPVVEGNAFNKNIVIEQDLTDQDIVLADEALCSTILRNLLTNAIKFTHPGGKIIVSTKRVENFLEISVSDTGVGIDPKNLSKIFRIDSKFSSLGTKKEKGTGLGLILCKEFVEKQGGVIRVESEKGKGTTFTFTLPLGK